MAAAVQPVLDYFLSLQDELCAALEAMDGSAGFSREVLEAPGGGSARPRVLADGLRIEKAAVQLTHAVGQSLPAAATERNPQLAGKPFQAASVSVIVHPRNPYVPTTHMNLRFFLVGDEHQAGTDSGVKAPHWHFGGGFDLTPCYGFEEDCTHWHRIAREAAGAHYPVFKSACDEYFYLPHRNECRGIGGLFFDDWTHGGFETGLDLVKRIGNAFLPAYRPVFERRSAMPFGERQRHWQLYRRGRYAEFNLAIDRGTRYGLQSGRRVESVLASLPPMATWRYRHTPEEGSPEANLSDYIRHPRDWLSAVDNSGD